MKRPIQQGTIFGPLGIFERRSIAKLRRDSISHRLLKILA
jgi:hypothetical protein